MYKESKFAEINLSSLKTTRWRIRFSKLKASVTSFTSKRIRIFEIVFRCGNVSQKLNALSPRMKHEILDLSFVQLMGLSVLRPRIFTVLCLLTCNMVQSLLGLASSPIFSVSSCSSSCCLSVVKLLRLHEFRLFIRYAWCFVMLWLRVWNLLF